MISIIDYGMGNCGSIQNMLRKIGAESTLVSSPSDVERAEKLILPGVGAFDNGMKKLRQANLLDVLRGRIMDDGVPILGICLGMQLFCEGSEEGQEPGLGWIPGRARKFDLAAKFPSLRIPHMGWNTLNLVARHPVLPSLEEDSRYYFVHSYHVQCTNSEDVVAISNYGTDFTAVMSRGPVLGVQFHPEKSLRWGMQLMKRFVDNVPEATAANYSVPLTAKHWSS